MLLQPAALRLHAPPGLPGTTSAPELSLSFDPWTKTLSWGCQENVSSVNVTMDHPDQGCIWKPIPRTQCRATFEDCTLHRGVTLTVVMSTGRGELRGTLRFTNPGRAASAARDVSCAIYDPGVMQCRWARGPAAPRDVQYFMFLRDSGKGGGWECPHYLEDAGTHVGCRVRNLSALGQYSYLLVNGSSPGDAVQFFDKLLSKKDIEVYSPPSNVSVTCNDSHCDIRWVQPSTAMTLQSQEFQYQLDIRRPGEPEDDAERLIEVPAAWGRRYRFPSPEPRGSHSARVRWANTRLLRWSGWSAPVSFGGEQQPSSPALLYGAMYVATVLGTLLVAAVLGLLCRRALGRCRLFPPVPRVRDKWTCSGHELQVSWEALSTGASKWDVEDVLTVQEVTTSLAGP